MSKDISKEIKIFAEGIKTPKDILDVGCGLRPYEQFFKNSRYTGIDIEMSGREAENKKPDKIYDGLNIPFPDESFDIAICTEVLEHCINPEKLLKEMHRVLKKKGVLFLTVPFIWGEHEIPYDFSRYSSYGIRKDIENAGFKITAQKKIASGVKTIEQLVSSEITNYKNSPSYNVNLLQKLKEFFLYYIWLLSLRLLDSTYALDRIYLDNLVIAEKILKLK